jgi:hypothetical protein
MLTVIESPLFSKLWPDYWSEEERGEFAGFIANNPEAGDVVPGSRYLYGTAGQGRSCSFGHLCEERTG